MRVERTQALACASQLADRIHMCQGIGPAQKALQNCHLQVPLRVVNANMVVLRKSLQQTDTLIHEAIPGITLFVFEPKIAVSVPFGKECRTEASPRKKAPKAFSNDRPKAMVT